MKIDSSDLLVKDIELPPPWPGANRNLLGLGSWVDPVKRLNFFGEDEFESFTLQWVDGYLSKEYYQVQWRGGAGDKGRDILAWIDPPNESPRKWDNYQCKHYKDPLTPTDFWLELGKLCYYTFNKNFTVPQKYYIVSPHGIGTSLQDLVDAPDKLCKGLVDNWTKYCEQKITSKAPVKLTGEFKNYVEAFDFSIITPLLPHELIRQHSQTKYHAFVFGSQLKPRPNPPEPPSVIAQNEVNYVQHMYDAFAEHLKYPIHDRTSFSHNEYLMRAFDHAREGFYSAESLKEFARDNLPNEIYFLDLMTQFLDGLQVVIYSPHDDGYYRMVAAHDLAQKIQVDANALRDTLRPRDRVGICHQLANENKLKWVNP